jgi:branched-chain amino acid transport system ATP-binding protein
VSGTLLEARGLSRAFTGVTAVDRVDLDVAEGTVHGLIGPNGAGKTTCFNMIAGALPPSAGRVVFDGTDITGWPSWRVSRAGIARTFQNIRVFSELSVRDNILPAALTREPASYLGSVFGSPRARRAARETIDQVEDLLQRMDIAPFRDEPAGDLPIGIQRRVEIARALALRPRLLLLDEPTAGMNSAETTEIRQVVNGLRGTTTVLLVEHDMSFVMNVCDRISVLDSGVIISEGTPPQVRTDQKVLDAYLGRPV